MSVTPVPSVLISDAEPHHTRVFEAKLSRHNAYSVTGASTATEALSYAFQKSFDVILWDMRLRETFTVLPRLRSLCPQAVLLLMTTDDRPVVPDEIARLTVADVLVKPIGLDTLIQRIENARQLKRPDQGTAHIEISYVGQTIRLNIGAEKFSTKIWEVAPDYFHVIASPRFSAPPVFEVGRRVMAEVLSDDALYRFVTRITDRSENPVSLWKVQMPALIRRYQRRRSLRRGLSFPLQLVALETSFGALTQDISLSGCLVLADTPLEVGSQVSLRAGDGTEGISGTGRVMRLESFSRDLATPEEQTRYRIALEFTDLASETRDFLQTLVP